MHEKWACDSFKCVTEFMVAFQGIYSLSPTNFPFSLFRLLLIYSVGADLHWLITGSSLISIFSIPLIIWHSSFSLSKQACGFQNQKSSKLQFCVPFKLVKKNQQAHYSIKPNTVLCNSRAALIQSQIYYLFYYLSKTVAYTPCII